VPAAIADEIVGGRCTHRPPAGASFPCFDCSFGCYNPRNCSQIADVPPPTVAYHAILTSLTHRSATPPGARRLVPGHRGGLAVAGALIDPARAVGIRRRPVRLGPALGRLPGTSPCG